MNKHSLLISSLHLIRSIRNACAHNERIVFFKKPNSRTNLPFESFLTSPNRYKKSRDIVFMDLLVSLKYYLETKEYEDFINQIVSMLKILESQININSFDIIRGNLGIKKLADLDYLKNNNHKKIYYNRF